MNCLKLFCLCYAKYIGIFVNSYYRCCKQGFNTLTHSELVYLVRPIYLFALPTVYKYVFSGVRSYLIQVNHLNQLRQSEAGTFSPFRQTYLVASINEQFLWLFVSERDRVMAMAEGGTAGSAGGGQRPQSVASCPHYNVESRSLRLPHSHAVSHEEQRPGQKKKSERL